MMLGRLEMTIKQCEDVYDTVSQRIFAASFGRSTGPAGEAVAVAAGRAMYDATRLEVVIKETLRNSQLKDENAKLRAERDPKCKVYVTWTWFPTLKTNMLSMKVAHVL